MFNPTYLPRQRWTYPKDHEKNFVAALFHLATIMMFCFSLTQLEWFCVWGGNCVHRVSLYQFFSFNSHFETIGIRNSTQLIENEVISSPFMIQYHSANGDLLPCITPDVVDLVHIIIILCFLAVLFSLIGFSLDVIGPTRKILLLCRRNALPSIMTVLLVISIVGVCYLVTRSLEISVLEMNIHAKVQVTYEYGCYIVSAAGAVSILATACNLLQPHTQTEDNQNDHLVEDWDGLETFSVGMRNIPILPPPYSP